MFETGQTTVSFDYMVRSPSGLVTMRFVTDIAKLAAAWPLYATYYAIVLANGRQGYGVKVTTFLRFLPVLVVTSAVWAMLWAFILGFVMRD